jgi:hypothetical protein
MAVAAETDNLWVLAAIASIEHRIGGTELRFLQAFIKVLGDNAGNVIQSRLV